MNVKVADRVRLCQSKAKPEAPESPEQYIPAPATSKYKVVQAAASRVQQEYDIEMEIGSRQEWSEEDTKIIKENLKKEKKCPNKVAIKWFWKL